MRKIRCGRGQPQCGAPAPLVAGARQQPEQLRQVRKCVASLVELQRRVAPGPGFRAARQQRLPLGPLGDRPRADAKPPCQPGRVVAGADQGRDRVPADWDGRGVDREPYGMVQRVVTDVTERLGGPARRRTERG